MRNREIVDNKSRSEWCELIFEWVHNSEDRKMLELYLLDDISVSDISKRFGYSLEWTQQRISRAKKQLFNHIKL